MKLFKRNMVVLTVLMFVCVAVYLNWSYSRGDKNSDTVIYESEETAREMAAVMDDNKNIQAEDAGLFYTGQEQEMQVLQEQSEPANSEYFAAAKLSREQSRDSAVNLLQETAGSSEASQAVKDDALAGITAMAEYTVCEADMENLLMAKGFKECLVFMRDDSVSVTVSAPKEGLTSAQVAQITDVVMSETGLGAEKIKIVEVK